jgi:epoxide hydrolase-like predicted phosphatase
VNIRAVIFDFGGVIERTLDPEPRVGLATRVGLTREELEQAVFDTETARHAALGQVSPDDLWDSICDNLQLARAERREVERAFWGGDQLNTELLDFIRSLRPQYKTALLSNAWLDLRPLITDVLKIADAFDAIIISSEVGVMKPDPPIYGHVLQELGVAPNEAVFVDDALRNVEGARAIGMHAIQFKETGQVIAELKQLL